MICRQENVLVYMLLTTFEIIHGQWPKLSGVVQSFLSTALFLAGKMTTFEINYGES